jgi:hypothetical protein
MIQIARDGEILGHVELAQIADALEQGTVLVTDHYWAEGMPEWRLVEELAPTPAVNQDVVGQVESSAEPVEPANDKRDWRTDPATAKQIAFLESLGVSVAGQRTKGEVSELIDRYKDSPEAQAYQFAQWDKKQEAERLRRSDFPSFHMKVDIDQVCAEIGRIESDLLEIPKSDRRGSRYVGDLRMELADLKDKLKTLRSIRAKYWRFTFRADWIDGDPECDLVDYGDAINRHHSEQGRFLKVPTLKEVKEILAELDSGHPGWDQTMPEAFYARFNARNPDVLLPPNKVR